MFKVAVINFKKIVKNIFKIIIVALIVAMIIKFSSFRKIGFNAHVGLISNNLRIGQERVKERTNIIFKTELVGISKFEEEIIEKEDENIEEEQIWDYSINEINNDVLKDEEKSTEELKIDTQIIETKNKKEIYTNVYGSVKIRNESKYELTEDMIKPTVEFNNKTDILIFHTHTCESYTQTPTRQYVATGNYRTTDQNNSVVHVGEVLTNLLVSKGYNVRHNKTYHDYPSFSGSYNRSYKTVSQELKDGDWTEFVIDLHRDAIGNGSDYGPTIRINNEIVAQLMFVIGTDGGGLEHPNWLNNFKLAVKIQEKANEIYPGLFKPIILRNSRYNQNLASGACIIEVGATRKYYRRM
ncbi:MAG: stage II sporulation protein P [Clostridia bacterium]|nr:stage II sporulation protein P [Clostridia bacterium]